MPIPGTGASEWGSARRELDCPRSVKLSWNAYPSATPARRPIRESGPGRAVGHGGVYTSLVEFYPLPIPFGGWLPSPQRSRHLKRPSGWPFIGCTWLPVGPNRDPTSPPCDPRPRCRSVPPWSGSWTPCKAVESASVGVKPAVRSVPESLTRSRAPRATHPDPSWASVVSRNAPSSPACPKTSNSSAPSMR